MAEKKKTKPASPTEAEANLTPMIDVTFLLLIFFVLNLKFKVEEGEIQSFLPKDKGQSSCRSRIDLAEVRLKLLWCELNGSPSSSDKGSVVLKIGRNAYNAPGDLDVNMEEHPVWERVYSDLLGYKNNYQGGGENGQPVIIDSRQEVPYRYVVRSLNEVLRAGIEDVTFASPNRGNLIEPR